MTLDRRATNEKHKNIRGQEDTDISFDEEMMEMDPAIIKNTEFLHLARELFDSNNTGEINIYATTNNFYSLKEIHILLIETIFFLFISQYIYYYIQMI